MDPSTRYADLSITPLAIVKEYDNVLVLRTTRIFWAMAALFLLTGIGLSLVDVTNHGFMLRSGIDLTKYFLLAGSVAILLSHFALDWTTIKCKLDSTERIMTIKGYEREIVIPFSDIIGFEVTSESSSHDLMVRYIYGPSREERQLLLYSSASQKCIQNYFEKFDRFWKQHGSGST